MPDGAALVHCQWGNHEVATLQPVADLVDAAGALLHVDAAAAARSCADRVRRRGHRPHVDQRAQVRRTQGVGALLVRRGLRIEPLLVGGEQERARRGGLENVPAIVGFGAACAALDLEAEATRNRAQTARALAGALVGGGRRRATATLMSPIGSRTSPASASTAWRPRRCSLGSTKSGVAAHSGSACSSESLEPSPVLEAMGVDAERSLRISVGWSTTDADIDSFLTAFPDVVARLRALRG